MLFRMTCIEDLPRKRDFRPAAKPHAPCQRSTSSCAGPGWDPDPLAFGFCNPLKEVFGNPSLLPGTATHRVEERGEAKKCRNDAAEEAPHPFFFATTAAIPAVGGSTSCLMRSLQRIARKDCFGRALLKKHSWRRSCRLCLGHGRHLPQPRQPRHPRRTGQRITGWVGQLLHRRFWS